MKTMFSIQFDICYLHGSMGASNVFTEMFHSTLTSKVKSRLLGTDTLR